MKCLCGYEYRRDEWSWEGEKYINLPDIGKEEFIKIRGTFLLEKEYDYHPNTNTIINFYVCPKCYTVRIKDC
jgi:hypothetical protein